MERLKDAESTKVLLMAWGGWFGPPMVVELGNPLHRGCDAHVWDGRKRLAAWELLAMPGDPPERNCVSRIVAARLVCLAEHYQRAARMLGKQFDWTARPHDIALLLRVPLEQATALRAAATGKPGAGARTDLAKEKKQSKYWRRRSHVVQRMRRLYRDSLETTEPVTSDDLRNALGDWA